MGDLEMGPTRAERDALRIVEQYTNDGGSVVLSLDQARVLRRLLDWADAQETAETVKREWLAPAAIPPEGPARRALRRLVEAVRHDSADFGSSVITAGGQAPERGPWALRNPYHRVLWYGRLDGREGMAFVGRHRHIFARLGPATEEGTARWAQRMHGGVIVRVRQPDDGEEALTAKEGT